MRPSVDNLTRGMAFIYTHCTKGLSMHPSYDLQYGILTSCTSNNHVKVNIVRPRRDVTIVKMARTRLGIRTLEKAEVNQKASVFN